MSNVMVLGGGTLRKFLGHESEALTNKISVFVKEVPKSLLAPCEIVENTYIWSQPLVPGTEFLKLV